MPRSYSSTRCPLAIVAPILAPGRLALFPLLVIAARILQLAVLNRSMSAGLTCKQIALTPLLDTVMLYAWFVPFFSNRVTWRGYQARLGRNTEIIQVAA